MLRKIEAPDRRSLARRAFQLAAAAGFVLTLSGSLAGQSSLPFHAGEELHFRFRVGTLGTIGRGVMKVQGPESVRGQEAFHLSFDVSTRVGPVRIVDRTSSWLEPRSLASLRFHKHERHPLANSDEQVELFPAERRWVDADGRTGQSPTDAPLDELSFLYFIRTLPLRPGAEFQFDRHFQADRNPVTIRVLGREDVTVEAGRFATLLVEMRVRDPRRFRGEGVIRINLTDDDCRIPVRIRSTMPKAGETTLLLESHSHPPHHRIARHP